MNTINGIAERRRADRRRFAGGVPPVGIAERRINIERRLFDLMPESGRNDPGRSAFRRG